MQGDKADTWVPLRLELGGGPWFQGPRDIAQTGPGSESSGPAREGTGAENESPKEERDWGLPCPESQPRREGSAESADRARSLAGGGRV